MMVTRLHYILVTVLAAHLSAMGYQVPYRTKVCAFYHGSTERETSTVGSFTIRIQARRSITSNSMGGDSSGVLDSVIRQSHLCSKHQRR